MKRVEIETKKIDVVYVAVDGTEFEEKEQCEKYEKSAKGVVRGRVKALVLKESNEYGIFEAGCDDNRAWVIVPKNAEEIALIRQMFILYGNNEEQATKYVKDNFIGMPIVVTFDYEEECCWVKSLGQIVTEATDGKFAVVDLESAE